MATLPDNLRLYAIGDVHGRADLLREILDQIVERDRSRGPAASRLIFLGDYIDRGPESYEVIETLLHGLPLGMEADFLMGNHERMLLDALDRDRAFPLWAANGGAEALESYLRAIHEQGRDTSGFEGLRDVFPPAHVEFLENLKLSVVFGDYMFVHAGIRPGVAIDRQVPQDMLWIRGAFLDYDGDFGKVIVHGHTPAEEPEMRVNRIGIDTGAVFTGRLTALVLEGERRDFLST